MTILARKLRSTQGAEIAEAALVLPVVFVFLLGIVWFGRAFNIYSTIQQAAQQGAIAAARPSCAGCGNTFQGHRQVSLVVETVMNASSLDTSKIIANAPSTPVFCQPPYPSGSCKTTHNNISVCSNLLLNPSAPGATSPPANQAPICGVQVNFQYPFQLNLPFTSLNLSNIILTAQAQSRMED
jgi:hypothetical protein